MVYREPGQVAKMPEKEKLYLVHICYKKDKYTWSVHDWIRAKDSFKALKFLMNKKEVKDEEVWAQYVYSVDDFLEKDLEVE